MNIRDRENKIKSEKEGIEEMNDIIDKMLIIVETGSSPGAQMELITLFFLLFCVLEIFHSKKLKTII